MTGLAPVRAIGFSHSKRLVLTLAFAATGAFLIFRLSRIALSHPDFAGSIYESGVPRALAGFSLVAFPYVQQRLAGKRKLSFSDLPEDVVPFEEYTLPPYLVLIYGVLFAFAAAGTGIFAIWLAGTFTSIFVTRIIPILTLFILLVAFYYLGSWTGERSARSPFPIAVAIVLGYTGLELLVTLTVNLDVPLHSPFVLAVILIPSLAAAVTGARNGRRRRLSSYTHFLLRWIPEQERRMLVDLLYGAVKRPSER